MKRLTLVAVALLLVVVAGQAPQGQGQPSPEQQAAIARQEALEKATPQLQIAEDVLRLTVPGHTIGEAVGVAKNSKGNLFVFTRSGNAGPARGATASQLFEFDPQLRFVKQWGQDNYAASFAHNVRVDKYDNVWMTDEGSNMVVKFNPQGAVQMVLGRKPEAIDFLERYLERGEREPENQRYPVGGVGTFGRPTDVAFDSSDNVFIADGYKNSRVVKVNKDGSWNKAVGTRGAGMNQFNTVHAITTDAKNNVYVADRGNRRIQVFDAEGAFQRSISVAGVPVPAGAKPAIGDPIPAEATGTQAPGAPWTVCITPGPNQVLFTSDSYPGRIYKLSLDGRLLGMLGTSGKQPKQFGWIHEIACPSEHELYVAELLNWRVQQLTLK